MAIMLVIAGAWLAVLSVKAALVRALPRSSSSVAAIAGQDPDVVLGRASARLVTQRGILSPRMLAEVRRAASRAPLDARPYLVLGHQQLLDNQPRRALATLEAGRRLDPRQRLIHLLLLDRYLRTGRYADAATEFSVLARLVGSAQGPIATALAEMSLRPETRAAARRTLQTDARLERAVLVALARSTVPSAAVLSLASPEAQRDARDPRSWGPILINRLIEQQRYAEARSIWQRIYGLSAAQVAAPLYDAGLQGQPGSPPFNWMLTATSLGAADMSAGTLAIEYYGRESGELASQLLVLQPGTYHFRYVVEGGKAGPGSSLFWTLKCSPNEKTQLMRVAAAGSGGVQQYGVAFIVPDGCPAQRLALVGEAGEFPVPVNVTLRGLDLRAAESRP